MKLLYVFLLTACLCPCTLFAQKNFKPGYVITLKGDTVNGTIDFRGWDNNPRKVKFQPAKGAPYELTPFNTFYFDANGLGAYQRFAGPITLDKISDFSMLGGRDSTFRMDTVFLKVMQKGEKMTLYSYSDHIKVRFYFTEKDGEIPQELGYRLYYNSSRVDIYAGKGRTVNENTYMKQLYDLALKYDVLTLKLQRMIEDSRYEKTYILNIVSIINGRKK